MNISHALVGMAMRHEYREVQEFSESLVVVRAGESVSESPLSSDTNENGSSLVDLSAAGSLLAMQRQEQRLDLDAHMDQRSRLNLMILQAVFESITGRPLDISVPEPQQAPDTNQHERELQMDTVPPQVQRRLRSTPGGALVYQRHQSYEEKETLSLAAGGVITTQDGREIQFTAELTMSRQFLRASSERFAVMQWGSVNKVDPLVINFDGKGAELSHTRFSFDLDADGTAEQIASLRFGSGFLALDRNADGIITDGSELFGPSTGRGFAELSVFDEDGNQFIDEGDSIYQKLRIWMMNDDGSSQLVALGDKHIGAIYLGHMTTPFQLKDDNNRSLGEIANSGIYIAENGTAGIVQELNFTL